MPKQARWEAELLMLDATAVEAIARPLDDFSIASQSIARIAAMTEQIPLLVGQERQILERLVERERRESLADLERMRMATVVDLDQMRTATVADLQDERIALLDAVGLERTIILDALRDERQAISSQLDTELDAALASMDTVTHNRTEEIGQTGRELVDRVFWRLAQLCLALGIVAMGLLVAYFWHRRRMSRDASQPGIESSVIRLRTDRETTDVAGASSRSTGAGRRDSPCARCPSHFVAPNATVIDRSILTADRPVELQKPRRAA